MSSTQQVFAAGPPYRSKTGDRRAPPPARLGFQMGDCLCPALCGGVLVFVVYPLATRCGWPSKPALYSDLIADPLYLPTVVNTLLFVGLGVNVKMFLALLLSGFFMRRRWWIKALCCRLILPWALAAAQPASPFTGC